jgi:phosphopentomutase
MSAAIHTKSDDHGMDEVFRALDAHQRGLIFANLVDFDTIYGHRNDVGGYASNLERFDTRLSDLLSRLRPTDMLIITADHGNDPATPSTDHSREYVPLFVVGPSVRANVDLGVRSTFADLGQTIAEVFKVGQLRHGTSFLEQLLPA